MAKSNKRRKSNVVVAAVALQCCKCDSHRCRQFCVCLCVYGECFFLRFFIFAVAKWFTEEIRQLTLLVNQRKRFSVQFFSIFVVRFVRKNIKSIKKVRFDDSFSCQPKKNGILLKRSELKIENIGVGRIFSYEKGHHIVYTVHTFTTSISVSQFESNFRMCWRRQTTFSLFPLRPMNV